MNKLLQSMVLSQVNAVRRPVQAVQQVAEMGCVGYGGPYGTDACLLNTETVAYVKNDPYFNTYKWEEETIHSLVGGGQQ